jgi:hypothetical protein
VSGNGRRHGARTWRRCEARCTGGQVVEIWEYESDDHDRHISAIHCGLWSPAEALRHVAHARDVLDRHQPGQAYGKYPEIVQQCVECAGLCHSETGMNCGQPDAPWPCDEIVSLGKAWGVE